MACLPAAVFSQKQRDSFNLRNISYQNELNKNKIQILDSSLNEVKNQLTSAKQLSFKNFFTTASFLDAAISTCDNIRTLIFKESYRNKISSLNNPTSNELGFNLQIEIQSALKPLLEKAKHIDQNKFSGVLGSIVNTGARSVAGLISSGNIFSSVVSLVGNLSVTEKKISKNDLDTFITTIGKYFGQYERLYRASLTFSNDVEKLKSKLLYCQDDIKNLILDIILAYNKNESRNNYHNMNTEDLMLQYFDNKKLKEKMEKAPAGTTWEFPPDAVKSCKEITTSLQRLYNEYIIVYDDNYKEIKAIILETKNVANNIDQVQLNKTLV